MAKAEGKPKAIYLLILIFIGIIGVGYTLINASNKYGFLHGEALKLYIDKITKRDSDNDGITNYDEKTTAYCLINGQWVKVTEYSYSNCKFLKFLNPEKK